MPDQRKHRGPHPEDGQLFAAENWLRLREATADLSWLLTRGYALTSALKIVGDRYSLDARQRIAVGRCACGEETIARRREHQVQQADVVGHELWVDGYNILTTIESAISGGVLLHARDGPAIPVRNVLGIHESDICLMHQCRGLQSLARFLVRKFCGSEFAKFVVDQLQKLVGSGRMAVLDLGQDLRHVGHEKWPGTSRPERLIVTVPQGNSADGSSREEMPANGVSRRLVCRRNQSAQSG